MHQCCARLGDNAHKHRNRYPPTAAFGLLDEFFLIPKRKNEVEWVYYIMTRAREIDFIFCKTHFRRFFCPNKINPAGKQSLLGENTGARNGNLEQDGFWAEHSEGIAKYPVSGRTEYVASKSADMLVGAAGAVPALERGSVYHDLNSSPMGDFQKFSSTLL